MLSRAQSVQSSSHWIGDKNGGGLIKSSKDIIYVPAKAMKITWGRDPRFWKWTQLPRAKLPKDFPIDESGFGSVAELIQVNWLEATGSVDLANHRNHLTPMKTYQVIFHIKLKVDAFGWNKSPATLMLQTPDGRRQKRSEMLDSFRRGGDVWHEIHGGDFRVPANGTGEVEFGMFDVQNQWWKGGIVFAGVTIRPKLKTTSFGRALCGKRYK
ncbi:hypothetical protein Cni_G26608 [Canna indica]|uniref:Uncharacterized protein n=1 Tax=Canna indica TaxID=4628 RepID=A0AAQ3L014_9LILI|nr:hypothetical protein Cni_G26608 [Canna indica]